MFRAAFQTDVIGQSSSGKWEAPQQTQAGPIDAHSMSHDLPNLRQSTETGAKRHGFPKWARFPLRNQSVRLISQDFEQR